MTIIGTLAVTLKANTTKYKKGMKQARAITGKFALAVTAAAAATALLVKSQFKAIDTIAKLSDRLNITTEAYTGLQFAAAITGVENAVFAKSMEKMLDSISKTNQGLTTQAKSFADLKLSAKDLELLDAEQQFKAIADGMKNVKTATDRMRIARDIFGRGGAALVNTLALGTKGLEAQQAIAVKLGITFTRFDASRVEAANDAMLRVKQTFIGIGRVIAIQLAPFVSTLADNFTRAGTEGEGAAVKIVDAFRNVAEIMAVAAAGLRAFNVTLQSFRISSGKLSNLTGGLSDRDLKARVAAFKKLLIADSPIQVARDLFDKFDRDIIRSRQKSDLLKLSNSILGISPDTAGAAATVGGAGLFGSSLSRKLPAREIASLRSINPSRNTPQQKALDGIDKNTGLALEEQRIQTRVLAGMKRILGDSDLLSAQTFFISIGGAGG